MVCSWAWLVASAGAGGVDLLAGGDDPVVQLLGGGAERAPRLAQRGRVAVDLGHVAADVGLRRVEVALSVQLVGQLGRHLGLEDLRPDFGGAETGGIAVVAGVAQAIERIAQLVAEAVEVLADRVVAIARAHDLVALLRQAQLGGAQVRLLAGDPRAGDRAAQAGDVGRPHAPGVCQLALGVAHGDLGGVRVAAAQRHLDRRQAAAGLRQARAGRGGVGVRRAEPGALRRGRDAEQHLSAPNAIALVDVDLDQPPEALDLERQLARRLDRAVGRHHRGDRPARDRDGGGPGAFAARPEGDQREHHGDEPQRRRHELHA